MPQLDKIKEVTSFIRLLLGVFAGLFLALIGWMVTNYNRASFWILTLDIIGIVLSSVIIVFLVVLLLRKVKEIEKL